LWKCGNELKDEQTLVCKQCGSAVAKDLLYCTSCGHNLHEEEVKTQVKTSTMNIQQKNRIILYVGIGIVLFSLSLILVSLFFNWINYDPIFSRYSQNIYEEYFSNVLYNTKLNSSIYSSLVSYINIVKKFGSSRYANYNSLYKLGLHFSASIFLICFIVQVALLALTTIAIVKVIQVGILKQQLPKEIIKLNVVSMILYLASSIIIGSTSAWLIVGLLASILPIVVILTLEYIMTPNRPSLLTYLPKIVSVACLVIGLCFLSGITNIKFTAEDYGRNYYYTLNGFIRVPYVYLSYGIIMDGWVDTKTYSIIAIVSLVILIGIIVLLSLYALGLIKNIYSKTTKATKVIGWVLIGLLISLSITNLLLGRSYPGNYGEEFKISYGTTIVVIVFVLLAQISDNIKVKGHKELKPASV
jgi:hypothetical protein